MIKVKLLDWKLVDNSWEAETPVGLFTIFRTYRFGVKDQEIPDGWQYNNEWVVTRGKCPKKLFDTVQKEYEKLFFKAMSEMLESFTKPVKVVAYDQKEICEVKW